MFYGAFVLSKKGPLAKVWLAAHWDKKLTKAQVFETNVESTVDSIISPQVKMALRTSGHLLLGVVRIYSRKQKYLIHDLGEACAKIKMAFRPGVVDLPPESRVDNAEAITLPEIFHDFEAAVADLGTMDVEAQFTVNPSRASEITMTENVSSTKNDMFGEFGEFDLVGGDFGGGMEDIEVARDARTDMEITDRSEMQIGDMADGTLLGDDGKAADAITMEDRPPGLGGSGLMDEGFGFGDGGMMDFGEMPNVSDLTLDHPVNQTTEEEKREEKEATPMDVEQPAEQPTIVADQTVGIPDPAPQVEEEGFVLEPLDTTAGVEKKSKPSRKRRLVVDSDKEFSGQVIRSQFEDYKDTLQPKCFPPPTKKAMLWKEMASCEQLFSRSTSIIGSELAKLIVRHYKSDLPNEALVDAHNLELEELTSKDTILNIEQARDQTPSESIGNADATVNDLPLPDNTRDNLEPALDDFQFEAGEERPVDNIEDGTAEEGGDPTSRIIPEMPDLEGISESTEEQQQSNELSEEFEQRRWTKRTQQVIRVLDRGFKSKESVDFSVLTQRCNRKLAASRFYTCLLLAKEKMVTLTQNEPYSEITIIKGSKFTEAI